MYTYIFRKVYSTCHKILLKLKNFDASYNLYASRKTTLQKYEKNMLKNKNESGRLEFVLQK